MPDAKRYEETGRSKNHIYHGKDFYGKGEPVYHIERIKLETEEPFGGGEHISYVNGEYRGDSEFSHNALHGGSGRQCIDTREITFSEFSTVCFSRATLVPPNTFRQGIRGLIYVWISVSYGRRKP